MCNCFKGSSKTPSSVNFSKPQTVSRSSGLPVVTKSSRSSVQPSVGNGVVSHPRPTGPGLAGRPVVQRR